MNTYHLNSIAVIGGIWLIVVFCFCFLTVHIVKLARMGWDANAEQKKKNVQAAKKEEPKPTPTAPASTPEPVYYIVERKKKRTKASYTEPKEIRFK